MKLIRSKLLFLLTVLCIFSSDYYLFPVRREGVQTRSQQEEDDQKKDQNHAWEVLKRLNPALLNRAGTPGFRLPVGSPIPGRSMSRPRRNRSGSFDGPVTFFPGVEIGNDHADDSDADSTASAHSSVSGDKTHEYCRYVADSSRRATMADMPALLDMFGEMDEEARRKLVVYPGDYLRVMLTKAINRGSLYIALDGRRVVSIVKAYVLRQSEHHQVLVDEMHCIGKRAKLKSAGVYTQKSDGSLPYKEYERVDKDYVRALEFQDRFSKKRSVVYYGLAYTVKEWRGKGLNSALKGFAFSDLVSDLVTDALSNDSRRIYLVYGQVAENTGTTAEVKMFIRMIEIFMQQMRWYDKFVKSPLLLKITSQSYRACLPIFYEFCEVHSGKKSSCECESNTGLLCQEPMPRSEREWKEVDPAFSRLLSFDLVKVKKALFPEYGT